jgi:hypothetical protein
VQLPNGDGPSPPERYLDLRRFWSDQAIQALKSLEAIRRKNMPELPSASNLWDTAPRMGFDYLTSYQEYASYGAMGFYPGTALDTTLLALLVKGELPTPVWFNEFITAGSDRYGPPKGSIRMWAYQALIDYGQVFLAWTFNTHRGGEEQALFGVLDHDGTPSWKYRGANRSGVLEAADARLPARPQAGGGDRLLLRYGHRLAAAGGQHGEGLLQYALLRAGQSRASAALRGQHRRGAPEPGQ